jgi:hypothetical protein
MRGRLATTVARVSAITVKVAARTATMCAAAVSAAAVSAAAVSAAAMTTAAVPSAVPSTAVTTAAACIGNLRAQAERCNRYR